MSARLVLTPAGRLFVEREPGAEGDPQSGALRSVAADPAAGLVAAFSRSTADGLLELLRSTLPSEPDASLTYWRGVAERAFRAVCELGEEGLAEAVRRGDAEPLSEWGARDVEELLGSAPPMGGLEYLDGTALVRIRRGLVETLLARAASHPQGPAAFLHETSPQRHLVGRVTFHLAENRRDEERPFAFLATYAHRLSDRAKLQHLPLAEALRQYAGVGDRERLAELLEPVRRAAAECRTVRELLDSRALFAPQAWSLPQAYRFLSEVTAIERCGVVVRVPDWWSARRTVRPQVQVRIGAAPASRLGLDGLLDFRVDVAVDGAPLTDQERERILAATDGLLLLRGRWVEVDPTKLEEALKHWRTLQREHAGGIDFLQGMRLLSGMEADLAAEPDETARWTRVEAGPWLQETLERLRDPGSIAACEPGRGLHATLRPYQVDGVRWLWFLTRLGLGACLADDMGLGKTIQVIALMTLLRSLREETSGSDATISPAPAFDETGASPRDTAIVPAAQTSPPRRTGRSKSKSPVASQSTESNTISSGATGGGSGPPVLLPSVAASASRGSKNTLAATELRSGTSTPAASEALASSAPHLLVVPASLIGNWRQEFARFAPHLRVLCAHRSECDDETLAAIERDPLRALADVDVVVATYGLVRRAEWVHLRPWNLLVLDEAQAVKNPGAAQTRAVKRLRGTGRIVLTGTPVENRLGDLWSLFDFCNPGLLGSAREFGKFAKGLSKSDDPLAYGPLRRLVRPYILRRLKTDPSVAPDLPEKTEMRTDCGLSKEQAALYERCVRDAEDRLAADDVEGIRRRGLVLALLMQLKQICNHPAQFLGDGNFDPERSAKFKRLAELVGPIRERQERVLVFTQFQALTSPLAAYLAGTFGRTGLVLDGRTPVKRRQELVREFQSEEGPPFLVVSVKAGGTGLNLTAASHVVHFDRWWNPAVEDQATDRAFRIGQKRNVLVHKFVCRGTLEERIDATIRDKRDLAGQVLGGGGEAALTELGDRELLEFVSLDLARAVAAE